MAAAGWTLYDGGKTEPNPKPVCNDHRPKREETGYPDLVRVRCPMCGFLYYKAVDPAPVDPDVPPRVRGVIV